MNPKDITLYSAETINKMPVDVLAAWANDATCPLDEANRRAGTYAAVAELVEAARSAPDDVGMVYDDPDEGARYSCCYRPYQYAQYRHHSRPDPNKHADDCWYPRLRAALAKFGGA